MTQRLYRLLLLLLPGDFRRRHGGDMEEAFAQAVAAERGRPGARWRTTITLVREAADLGRTGIRLRAARRTRSTTTGGGGGMTHGIGFLTRLHDDARHAVRSLARRPGFTLFAAGTLALGVGATTAVFSALESVILNPLPYAGAERMVGVYRTVGGDDSFLVTPDEEHFEAWRERRDLFQSMVRIRTSSRALTGVGEPRQIQVAMVEPDFFEFLGLAPVLGRSFTAAEGAGAGGRVALISHALWQDAFGGARTVLGEVVTVDGDPYTVVGVVPPRAPIPPHPTVRMDVFTPFGLTPVRQAQVVARLREGVTTETVGATMRRLAAEAEEAGASPSLWHGSAQGTRAMMGEPVVDTLRLLMAAVVLLLLIACVNVSNLLLGRQLRRERETAVRSALGAGRGRLVREQLLESLGLGLLGGLAGLALARLAVHGMASLRGDALEVLGLVELNGTVLLFALLVSVTASAVFGVLPSVRVGWTGPYRGLSARVDRTPRRSEGRTRWALLTAEVALSFALLVGASLVFRSLWEMRGRDPGFRAEGLVALDLRLPTWKYEEDGWRGVDEEIETVLARLPGVDAVTRASSVPPGGGVFFGDVEVEGRGVVEGARLFYGHAVEHGYFAVMGQPVLEGREFTLDEVREGQPVTVLGEGAARRLFPDGPAVGGRIREGGEWRLVVGVVADVAHRGLGMPLPELQMYRPMTFDGGHLILRTRGDVDALMAAVRREVRAAEPEAVIEELASIDRMLRATLGRERFTTALLGAFAALALLLCAVGLYGVVAQAVSQRTREIGIRISMGARAATIRGMVLRQGLGATAAGSLLGVVLATAGLRVLESRIFGVTSTVPGAYVGAAALVTAIALSACWIPARRAARVDPAEALRSD